ncbi:hypothetical protein [Nocardiopsis suaedae]|uniref:MFS transporter n=1 Tax=Nocardiopsis suaedae TaxID=3018444 RepID=A0ABT4TE53_9ACTN|nr:hypothetical protein [Nocardiopsis suaedae]MDA2802949.1 hypothetical protein [Nocardiopsis suaedae]
MARAETFRTVRAGVFASVSVGVSAAGHAAMSDHVLPPVGPVAGFLLLFTLAWAAAEKERGLAGICALMLWGQLALHLLFSFAQAGAGSHHAGAAGAAEAGAAVADGGTGMLAAHMVAALISGWWLRQGEAALFGLLRLLGLLILPVLLVGGSGAAAPPPPSTRRPDRGDGGRIARGLRHTVVLRGPPLRC